MMYKSRQTARFRITITLDRNLVCKQTLSRASDAKSNSVLFLTTSSSQYVNTYLDRKAVSQKTVQAIIRNYAHE